MSSSKTEESISSCLYDAELCVDREDAIAIWSCCTAECLRCAPRGGGDDVDVDAEDEDGEDADSEDEDEDVDDDVVGVALPLFTALILGGFTGLMVVNGGASDDAMVWGLGVQMEWRFNILSCHQGQKR